MIATCDPLNLTGTPGGRARVPASPDSQILIRDGLPLGPAQAGCRQAPRRAAQGRFRPAHLARTGPAPRVERLKVTNMPAHRGRGHGVGGFTSLRVKVDCMALIPGSRRIVVMAKSA